jgi:hypothetical protein
MKWKHLRRNKKMMKMVHLMMLSVVQVILIKFRGVIALKEKRIPI